MNGTQTNNYNELPALLKPNEAAGVLNCCTRTVTRMCELGKLKAVKVGSGSKASWRINRAALFEYAGIEIGEA